MYDPVDYWKIRGLEPADEFTAPRQEFIRKFLKYIEFDSVFEIGCGDGQFTRLLLERIPIKLYYGLDISLARLNKIKSEFDNLNVEQGDIRFFETKSLFDLVCCSFVLLHIPPDYIKAVIQKLINSTQKHFVFFEPALKQKIENWQEHNFDHDYYSIIQELGYKVDLYRFDDYTGIYHVRKS